MMHIQRIALVISAIVGIIGTFLPSMEIGHFTTSLIETKDGTGYLVIGSFIICLIVSLGGDRCYPIKTWHLNGVLIPGILPGVLLLIFAVGCAADDLTKIFTNLGIGFYLTLIASVSVVICGIALKGEAIETESSEES